MKRYDYVRASLLVLLSVTLAASLFIAGCGDEDSPSAPIVADEAAPVTGLSLENPLIQSAIKVQNKHTPDLMQIPDVVGTAVGVTELGDVAIKLYVTESVNKNALPYEADGLPVVVVETGRLVARGGNGGGMGGGGMGGSGADPQAPQSAPIKLGTSGGWRYDLANGFCCGGTLGSLIQSGGTQYVLSNYHVLYADTTPGGNGITAQPGDPVIQPGLIDVGCNANGSINVATLVANGGSLPGANIDAGIAAVISGQVASDGEILEIGVISSQTVGAFVGQDVKKMGRTTGLGRGTVDGLNANVSITYSDECAGGTDFTKNFTGQIIITNNRCQFLDGGDSGSLMVEDVTNNPRAVGLLFAGSVTCNRFAVAVANPIDDVLSHYNASMVGN